MAEPEQSQALEEAELESVEELGDALDWEARGWPSWAEYRPIAEAALRHGLPMRPGKPSRALVRRLSQGEGLPADLAGRLAWQRPYPAGVEEALRKELRESHCRSEEHTSELQSLMRISYAVFCLKKKKRKL